MARSIVLAFDSSPVSLGVGIMTHETELCMGNRDCKLKLILNFLLKIVKLLFCDANFIFCLKCFAQCHGLLNTVM